MAIEYCLSVHGCVVFDENLEFLFQTDLNFILSNFRDFFEITFYISDMAEPPSTERRKVFTFV